MSRRVCCLPPLMSHVARWRLSRDHFHRLQLRLYCVETLLGGWATQCANRRSVQCPAAVLASVSAVRFSTGRCVAVCVQSGCVAAASDSHTRAAPCLRRLTRQQQQLQGSPCVRCVQGRRPRDFGSLSLVVATNRGGGDVAARRRAAHACACAAVFRPGCVRDAAAAAARRAAPAATRLRPITHSMNAARDCARLLRAVPRRGLTVGCVFCLRLHQESVFSFEEAGPYQSPAAAAYVASLLLLRVVLVARCGSG
jgi:hypothetical protein